MLAPRDPYPTLGGDRVRIHRVMRELARRHDLTLLTFCGTRAERDRPLPGDGVFKAVHRVVLPRWRSWLNALAALPTGEPLQVAYYSSEAFRAAVRALAPSHDAVVAHLVRTAQYARDLPIPKLLEMTDAISMNLDRVASIDFDYFDPRRWLYALEAPRMRAYERRSANEFDLVTLVSAADKSHLCAGERAANRHVIVVPNGVDAPRSMPPPQARRRPGEIVFVGHMGTLQNFDAVRYFAHHVLPRVRDRRPEVVLRVVGPLPSLAERRLRGIEGVRLEGVVPSLEQSLASARVGVCPTRAGSGIQNKVLDYFANRLAVVTSPLGAEGIADARHGKHFLVASSAEEWAARVLQLLEDEALAQRLADAGRALARARFCWSSRVAPLDKRIDQLLDRTRPLVTAASAGHAPGALAPVLVKS